MLMQIKVIEDQQERLNLEMRRSHMYAELDEILKIQDKIIAEQFKLIEAIRKVNQECNAGSLV
jgi:ABC-type phosphate transport system auxiliary subunit